MERGTRRGASCDKPTHCQHSVRCDCGPGQGGHVTTPSGGDTCHSSKSGGGVHTAGTPHGGRRHSGAAGPATKSQANGPRAPGKRRGTHGKHPGNGRVLGRKGKARSPTPTQRTLAKTNYPKGRKRARHTLSSLNFNFISE